MISLSPDRKTRLSLLSGTGLLLVLGVFAFANLLADQFFLRWDWTANRRYSLSEASRALLKGLEDPVTLRFYLTPGLPQPYGSQGRYIHDLLKEYRAAGRGKVKVDVRAPDNSEGMMMEVRRLNLQPARFTEVASDQFQVREGYMGLVILYQDKQDTLPFVKDAANLEFEISSRLLVLTQKSKKTLFFISNHNEVSPNFIKEGRAGRLFDEFRVEPIRLSTADSGLKADAVFLLGPQSQLNDDEIAALDTFVSSGIPVVVALNRRVVDPRNFRSMAQVTGLEPWLEHYGVRVERDFVMDDQCQNIAMQSGQTSFYVKYWPFIQANDINRENPASRGLDVLGFPFAHPLVSTIDGPSSLEATVLARSSRKSWVWSGLYNVDPPSLFNQAKAIPPSGFAKGGGGQTGPFPLAIAVEGSTTTFRDPRRPVAHLKLVVIGTSFFADPQVPNPEENALFILSLAHWLTQDGAYLSIPPKGSPFRPLKPLPGIGRALVKGAGFFLIPGLIIFAGFLHWRRRRTTREVVRRSFQEVPRA